ncbi:hypothetical protein [Rugosimonospora africana]|nr:hypothetical protein [Rugosimonospora africana]
MPSTGDFNPEQIAANWRALNAAEAAPAAGGLTINDIGPRQLNIPGPVVTEQPLYRFDGQPAQRSFLTDLLDTAGVTLPGGRDPDPNARNYALAFMAHPDGMAASFANITKANVATLNPTQRSDVPATLLPARNRPLWDACSNSPLTSNLSITTPRVTDASGMANAHTEGDEPTTATLTITASDIAAPAPISGKASLSRTLIDYGPPALVDQIVFGLMLQAWAQVVEARIAAMLDGLSLAAGNIVNLAGMDDDLRGDWDDILIPLATAPDGGLLTSLVLAGEAYGPTRRAADDSGRRYYRVGPGGVLDLGSHLAAPAAALTAANGGGGDSYLFNPAVVHAAEMTNRFTFLSAAVSYVDVCIWGYSTAWCSQPADVYRLDYSAS